MKAKEAKRAIESFVMLVTIEAINKYFDKVEDNEDIDVDLMFCDVAKDINKRLRHTKTVIIGDEYNRHS